MQSGELIVYMLKVAFYLVLFYSMNKLMLSRETTHRFNRFFWLFTVVLSFVLPFIVGSKGLWASESTISEQHVYTLGDNLELAVNNEVGEEGSVLALLINIAFFAYIVGLVVFLSIHIFKYLSLYRFLRTNAKTMSESILAECNEVQLSKNNIKYVIHSEDIAPFSWMNYIVVSERDLKENGREILIHELSHCSEYHSFDIILLNLIATLQWFNPIVWLIKNEVQQVHEYCADDAVITSGVNIKNYQLLLIKKTVGTRLYTMSNSLNHSNLKNRITMMLKRKSNRWSRAKCLYVLPLTACVMSVYANPTVSDKLSSISDVKITNKIDTVKVSDDLNGKILTVGKYPNMSNNASAKHVPLKQIAAKLCDVDMQVDYLYSIDGYLYAVEPAMVSNEIKSITILSAKAYYDVTGHKVGAPVILVEMKEPIKITTAGYMESKKHIIEVLKTDAEIKSNIKKGDNLDNKKILYIVDGVKCDNMDDIDPETIKSITILKDAASKAVYGSEYEGVIIVELKK